MVQACFECVSGPLRDGGAARVARVAANLDALRLEHAERELSDPVDRLGDVALSLQAGAHPVADLEARLRNESRAPDGVLRDTLIFVRLRDE